MKLKTKKIHDEADFELSKWGDWLKRRRYLYSHPKCTLASMIEFGVHVPSGYGNTIFYEEIPPDILRTKRVWAFMRSPSGEAVYQFYATKGTRAEQAIRAGLSSPALLDFYVKIGKIFYCSLEGEDFSFWN